jgi:hypothetical protein
VSLSQQRGTASLAANHISGLAPWRYLWVYVLPDTAAAAVNVYWQSSPVGPADGQLTPGQYRLFDTGSTSTRDVWFTPTVAGQAIDIEWITDTDPVSEQVSTPGPMQVEGTVNVGSGSITVSGTPTVNVAPGQSIAITGTPTVNIAAGQSISISAGSVALTGGQSGVLIETAGGSLDLQGASRLGQVTLAGNTLGNNVGFTLTGPGDLVVVVQNENVALQLLASVSPSVGVANGDAATLPAATSVIPRATLFVPAADLAGALSVKLQWLNYVSGSSNVLGYATVYRLRPGYLTAWLNANVTPGTPKVWIPGVTGKTITVYSLDISVAAPATAAGGYQAYVQDTTGVVFLANPLVYLATGVGQAASASVVKTWEKGIPLPSGAGLEVLTSAASGNPFCAGTVQYTQI